MNRAPRPSRNGVLALACLGLLMLLGAGFALVPQKLPTEGKYANYDHPTEPRLKGWSDPRLTRQPGESDLELATRLTQVIGSAIYHCDPDDYRSVAGRLSDLLDSPAGDRQGLLNPRLLNCGYCHQVAYVLARALTEQGVRARVFGLNGHVVTRFRVGEQRYIADPDLGIEPLPYTETLWRHAEASYSAIPWVGPEFMTVLQSVFATLDDDGPYYSMDFLTQLEKRQVRIYKAIRAASVLAGLAGLALVAWAALAFLRHGHNDSTKRAAGSAPRHI